VRARLAVLLTAAMTLVLAAFLVPLAVLVQKSAAHRATIQAIELTQTLSVVVGTGKVDDIEQVVAGNNAGGSPYPVTVYLPGNRQYGPAPRDEAVLYAEHGHSYTAQARGGRDVLVPVAGGASGVAVVRAFVSDEQLGLGVHRAWLILALLGFGLLVGAVVVGDWLTRAVLRPIRELADVSHELAAGNLERRSRVHGPVEIRAVSAGLNHLAGRIQDLLRQERESVADLSHQLRTPLTALRLEVDTTPGARSLAPHVAALEEAVTRVIEQARAAGTSEPPACDATGVLAARCGFWAALAEDQRRAMRIDLVRRAVPVGVSEGDLRACVDALLGNVFAHTPEGTPFAVILLAQPGGGARLVIEDAGPGFPPLDELGRGRSGAGSTGLGLDIARRTARSSGGDLRLYRPSGRGARIVVDFGPPEDTAVPTG